MKRVAVILTLLLPLVAFAVLFGLREAELREASTWQIPVTGADPLDQLRGRYAVVQLDWTLTGLPDACTDGCTLCLEKKGTEVLAHVATEGAACPARLETKRSRIEPVRFRPLPRLGREEDPPLPGIEALPLPLRFRASVFVPEARADDIEARLNAGETMILVAKLTRTGRLMPERLEPMELGKRQLDPLP